MRVRKYPGVPVPHGNSSVWRYWGLDKFLDLLVHSRLYFTNAERLTDRFEAMIPRRNLDVLRSQLEKELEDPKEVDFQINYREFQARASRRLTLSIAGLLAPTSHMPFGRSTWGGLRLGLLSEALSVDSAAP